MMPPYARNDVTKNARNVIYSWKTLAAQGMLFAEQSMQFFFGDIFHVELGTSPSPRR